MTKISTLNLKTEKVTDRVMTEDELKDYLDYQARAEAAIKAEQEAQAKLDEQKASAISKLTALGLTEAEIQALAG